MNVAYNTKDERGNTMKLRNGFVSNSSSCSFVIKKVPIWPIRIFRKLYLWLELYKMTRWAKGLRKMECKHCGHTWYQHKSRKVDNDCGCQEEEVWF